MVPGSMAPSQDSSRIWQCHLNFVGSQDKKNEKMKEPWIHSLYFKRTTDARHHVTEESQPESSEREGGHKTTSCETFKLKFELY